MTYREPAENQSRAKRSAAEERLQRQLEQEEHAKEEKERHAKERAERERRREPTPEQVARAEARARRLECYPIRFRDVLFALALFGGMFALRFVLFDASPSEDDSDPWTGAAFTLGALLGVVWLYASPHLQLRSEERWSQRLPFRIEGFVNALEREYSGNGLYATIVITLRPEVSEVREDLLQKLALRIYPSTNAVLEHGDDRIRCILRSDDLADSKSCRNEDEESWPKARKYRRWMLHAMGKAVFPLAEVYPIESVKL